MTRPRREQISLDDTPFYHCYVRCVRQAFLFGDDKSSGKNYDHRKQWIVTWLRNLSTIFAIDICAYAVMSNHYHVVLHVDKNRAEGWQPEDVVDRWKQLYKGEILVERWREEPGALNDAELEKVDKIIEHWRSELYNISRFMWCINEKIARMSNKEENKKGCFWDGRFKSQALLDETALLSCMAYVDLNPVRAGIAEDLNSCDFTSIQRRIHDYSPEQRKDEIISRVSKDEQLESRIAIQEKLKCDLELHEKPEAPLMPFSGSSHTDIHHGLPFILEDYFDLVDTTGRIIREDKRGFISRKIPKLIHQLGIDPNGWIAHVKSFNRSYAYSAGSTNQLTKFAECFGRQWAKWARASKTVYRC